jgi:hypothetical protein
MGTVALSPGGKQLGHEADHSHIYLSSWHAARRPCRCGTRPEEDKLNKLERLKDSALCRVARESHSAPYFVLFVLAMRLRNVSFRFGACGAL